MEGLPVLDISLSSTDLQNPRASLVLSISLSKHAFFCFISSYPPMSQSIIEEFQGRNHGGMLTSDLLPWLVYAAFYTTRTTCLGTALPTEGWALPHQSITKKRSHRHAHRPVWGIQFYNWGILFLGDSSLCQWEELILKTLMHCRTISAHCKYVFFSLVNKELIGL